MKSIMQSDKECFICGRTEPLHLHHCLAGSYRTLATKYGLTVHLCAEHHLMVHDHEELMRWLRRMAQIRAMDHYGWTEEEFIEKIGRSFL